MKKTVTNILPDLSKNELYPLVTNGVVKVVDNFGYVGQLQFTKLVLDALEVSRSSKNKN